MFNRLILNKHNMKTIVNSTILFFLIVSKVSLLHAQSNAIRQELSAGGNFIFVAVPKINEHLKNQNFPAIGTQLGGTHLNYSVCVKKYMFAANFLWSISDNVSNGYKNKSTFNSFGFSAYYPVLNASNNKLYIGLSAQASVFQTVIVQNQIQDIRNLNLDRVMFYNNNWSFGGKLLYNMFGNSKFPLMFELAYFLGFNNEWKIDNPSISSIPISENFNRFAFSIDIPIIRSK